MCCTKNYAKYFDRFFFNDWMLHINIYSFNERKSFIPIAIVITQSKVGSRGLVVSPSSLLSNASYQSSSSSQI